MNTDIRKSIILKNSRGSEAAFEIRRCSEKDCGEIMLLQDEVASLIADKEMFAITTEDEITESLALDFCAGVYDDDRLVAFTLMIIPRITPRNLAVHFNVSREELLKSVTFDASFVHPGSRGYGMQNLFLDLRCEEALRLGAGAAYATVSPKNTASLRNLTSSGFKCAASKVLYGGKQRYIMRKELIKEDIPGGTVYGSRNLS